MAISRMTKVLIIGHISEFNNFIIDLQKRSIIHLTDLSQKKLDLQKKTAPLENAPYDNNTLLKLEEIRKFLDSHRKQESLLHKLLSPPRSINWTRYDEIAATVNPGVIIGEYEGIKKSLDALNLENEQLAEKITALEPWKDINIRPGDIGRRSMTTVLVGSVENKRLSSITESPVVDHELVSIRGEEAIISAAYLNSDSKNGVEILDAAGFKHIDIPEKEKSPSAAYRESLERAGSIGKEKSDLEKMIRELIKKYDQLMVLLEYYSNEERRSRVFEKWISTDNAFILSGWIRSGDREQLASIIKNYGTLEFEEIAADAGESPPVMFSNTRLFSPFQLITRLYSYPSYKSIDPSPVLSIYFVIFFGITLTDAGYGLILMCLAFIGLKKFKGGHDFLWILFWGGLFTIVAGLLTGGIFGDLFRTSSPFINAPFLGTLREQLIWFDPMVNPMIFFRLVLFLGVVHIITGMFMGLIANIKMKNYGDAIIDNFAWIVILCSLITILFSTDACVQMSLVSSAEHPLPSAARTPAEIMAAFMALMIFLFGARNEKSIFFRFFIGFLKLLVLSGIFSYIGDILSYIRLMALGMVTAGIGMAVNTIAFLMYDIPFVGIFFTIAVLVFGHLFNMAINMLGGFVHSLRLQYVEFFSKFFVGGGKEFLPLSNSGKYIEITE